MLSEHSNHFDTTRNEKGNENLIGDFEIQVRMNNRPRQGRDERLIENSKSLVTLRDVSNVRIEDTRPIVINDPTSELVTSYSLDENDESEWDHLQIEASKTFDGEDTDEESLLGIEWSKTFDEDEEDNDENILDKIVNVEHLEISDLTEIQSCLAFDESERLHYIYDN